MIQLKAKKNFGLNTKSILIIVIAMMCVIFVSNAFVLSNYGEILTFLGVPNSDAFIGTPKLVPGLDLEAYIYTPHFQILVNNDFERFNKTSLFNEDLKSLYSLPIVDWGLIFKPNLWSFFIIPPAYAFSLFQLISILLFIIGYAKLGQALGASTKIAYLFSTMLFFTGFVQVWWLLFGATLAVFPWIILLLISNIKNWIKYLLLYYVTCCWLITNFYPPLFIGLGFVAAILYITLQPRFYRSILLIGIVGIFTVATVLLYLWEPIEAIKNSTYPGNRIASGGSDFPAVLWLNQIFPSLLQAGTQSLISVEMAEAAAITSYTLLILIFFKDYSSWFTKEQATARKVISILLCGLFLMWTWMLLPLPSWLGSIFLWDHVQPRRLVAASGILIFAICCFIAGKFPWKISFSRTILFSLFIVLPWISYKYQVDVNYRYKLIDILPVLASIVCFIIFKIRKGNHAAIAITLLAALAVNISIFGRYNPIQSAKSIFNPSDSAGLQAISEIAKNSPNEVVSLNRFEGAVLNGLGFKSGGHALLKPQPDVYRKYFSYLDKNEFNLIFNRTASIRVFHDIAPNASGLGVNVPIDSFGANLEIRKLELIDDITKAGKIDDNGGEISNIQFIGDKILLTGWGRWFGISNKQILFVYSTDKIRVGTLNYSVNGRGAEHIVSNYHLTLERPEGWTSDSGKVPICLISHDPILGTYLLASNLTSLECEKILSAQ